jgi:hypothetical protein
MRFDDFPAEGQPEARACLLRREERQQRIPQYALREPCAAVGHLDHKSIGMVVHHDGDVIGRRARFRRVLQQIDHHLFELAGVENSLAWRQRPFEVKRHCALQTRHEL